MSDQLGSPLKTGNFQFEEGRGIMGVDIAVAILQTEVQPDQLISIPNIVRSGVKHIYFIYGRPSALTANRHPLAIWASGELDWEKIGKGTSLIAGRFCLLWKSDHASTGGYLIYENGSVSSARTGFGDLKDDFVDAFASAFQERIRMTKRGAIGFPEATIWPPARCVKCSLVKKGVYQCTELGEERCRQVVEHELDAECVLPFDVDA